MARVITALNGRLPASALTTVAKGRMLRVDAAAAYLAARAAGCPAGITSAYRTREEQAKLRAKYEAGEGASAERPGRSWHGEGLALDLPAAPRAWMFDHPEYGWRRTIMPSEPWHFEWFPDLYTITEDDMPLSQSDLEAIDRVVAGRLDERVRQSGQWGAAITQASLEAIDRIVASRLDERLHWLVGELPKHLPAGSGVTPAQVAEALRVVLRDGVGGGS